MSISGRAPDERDERIAHLEQANSALLERVDYRDQERDKLTEECGHFQQAWQTSVRQKHELAAARERACVLLRDVWPYIKAVPDSEHDDKKPHKEMAKKVEMFLNGVEIRQFLAGGSQ